MNETDPWSIGTLNKRGIWSYYVALNYLGVGLCSLLIFSVARNRGKSSTDILIAGLCSGCLWMSLTCGSQCLVSVIHNYFYGGSIACQLEAFFHISAILVQFFSVAAIAIRSWLLVNRNINMGHRAAYGIVACIWVVCILVTYLLSLVSPIYLMTAGTYCFFAFSSPAIAFWLLPCLVAALLIMIGCYVQIARTILQSADAISPLRAPPASGGTVAAPDTHAVAVSVAKRSAIFVAVLLLGWGFAAVASLYELNVGLTPEWLVTAVGVGGVTHSVAVPLTYAYTSKFHLRTISHLLHCRCAQLCRKSGGGGGGHRVRESQTDTTGTHTGTGNGTATRPSSDRTKATAPSPKPPAPITIPSTVPPISLPSNIHMTPL